MNETNNELHVTTPRVRWEPLGNSYGRQFDYLVTLNFLYLVREQGGSIAPDTGAAHAAVGATAVPGVAASAPAEAVAELTGNTAASAAPVEVEVGDKIIRFSDEDGDGIMSAEEAMMDGMDEAQFAKLDANGDGEITRAEFAAFVLKVQVAAEATNTHSPTAIDAAGASS